MLVCGRWYLWGGGEVEGGVHGIQQRLHHLMMDRREQEDHREARQAGKEAGTVREGSSRPRARGGGAPLTAWLTAA